MYQMAITYPKCLYKFLMALKYINIFQSTLDPPKFTQIGILFEDKLSGSPVTQAKHCFRHLLLNPITASMREREGWTSSIKGT
jgi:hypothetical protein